jgi:hypothetical protein
MIRMPAEWAWAVAKSRRDLPDKVIYFHTPEAEKELKGPNSMKLIVRTFVAVLVLTGAVATTQTSAATTNKITAARTSMLPIPSCAPNDPNACGMGLGGR